MVCPYCNAENRDGAMFCTHCGRELSGAAPETPAAPQAEQPAPVEQPYQQPPPPPQQQYPQQQYPQQPYPQQAPGYPPGAAPYDPGFQQAVNDAKNALIMAIVGIFCFWIILEPLAIVYARRAKKVLSPGDQGYGNAQAAEIIGWIIIGLVIVSVIFAILISATGN